jgi:hypothetical protein
MTQLSGKKFTQKTKTAFQQQGFHEISLRQSALRSPTGVELNREQGRERIHERHQHGISGISTRRAPLGA